MRRRAWSRPGQAPGFLVPRGAQGRSLTVSLVCSLFSSSRMSGRGRRGSSWRRCGQSAAAAVWISAAGRAIRPRAYRAVRRRRRSPASIRPIPCWTRPGQRLPGRGSSTRRSCHAGGPSRGTDLALRQCSLQWIPDHLSLLRQSAVIGWRRAGARVQMPDNLDGIAARADARRGGAGALAPQRSPMRRRRRWRRWWPLRGCWRPLDGRGLDIVHTIG